MAYQSNIPQPTDQISVSQADILNNFIALSTFLNINHVDFASADQGKHKFVSFPVQAVAPVTTGTEVALYSKTSALSGLPELFFREASSGNEYEFTTFGIGPDGYVRTPAGVLIKWGNASANGAAAITFPVGPTIPVFTSVYSAQVSVNTIGGGNTDPDRFVTVNAISTTQLTVFGSARSTTGAAATNFTYLVIGL